MYPPIVIYFESYYYRYQGPLIEISNLTKAIDGGASSVEYTGLVHTLSFELKELYNLEEVVSKTTSADDCNAFLLELSSFLREINCPYVSLMTGISILYILI